MVKALIFDFDGLILDTEGPEFQAWQEVYTAHGSELKLAAWSQGIGTLGGFDPYGHLEAQLGRPVRREDLRGPLGERTAALIAQLGILPGVTELIKKARQHGLKVGLASSSHHAWVDGHLARLGILKQFDCIRCADDVKAVKPDPELYMTVLAYFNIEANEAIAFEDSPNGILAAKRAGLFCIAVPNPLTAQLALDRADLRVASLETMPIGKLSQLLT